MSAAVTFHDLIQHVGISESQLDKQCSKEHRNEVAIELGNWLDYEHLLELSSLDVASIRSDVALSYSSQCRKALDIWDRRNGYKATYRRLVDVFLKGGDANGAKFVCQLVKCEFKSSLVLILYQLCMPC